MKNLRTSRTLFTLSTDASSDTPKSVISVDRKSSLSNTLLSINDCLMSMMVLSSRQFEPIFRHFNVLESLWKRIYRHLSFISKNAASKRDTILALNSAFSCLRLTINCFTYNGDVNLRGRASGQMIVPQYQCLQAFLRFTEQSEMQLMSQPAHDVRQAVVLNQVVAEMINPSNY